MIEITRTERPNIPPQDNYTPYPPHLSTDSVNAGNSQAGSVSGDVSGDESRDPKEDETRTDE